MNADGTATEGQAGTDGTVVHRRLGPVAWLLTALVRAYQLVVSPWLGPSCRFEPSCSAYAVDALRLHGAVRGSWLILRRLARCQPFCTGGYDPVPEPRGTRRRFSFRRPGVHPPADGPTPEASPAKLSEIVDPERRVVISEVGNPVGVGSLGRGVPPC